MEIIEWTQDLDYTFKIRLNEKNKEELIRYIFTLSDYIEKLQRQNKELQQALRHFTLDK